VDFLLDKMGFLSYNISSDSKIKTCLPIFGVKNLKCEGYMEFILYALNINGENNQLLPSILRIYYGVGGIFIHFYNLQTCRSFYVRFVRFV